MAIEWPWQKDDQTGKTHAARFFRAEGEYADWYDKNVDWRFTVGGFGGGARGIAGAAARRATRQGAGKIVASSWNWKPFAARTAVGTAAVGTVAYAGGQIGKGAGELFGRFGEGVGTGLREAGEGASKGAMWLLIPAAAVVAGVVLLRKVK